MSRFISSAILLTLALSASGDDRAPCGPDPIARQLLAHPVEFPSHPPVAIHCLGAMRDSFMLVIDVDPNSEHADGAGIIFESAHLDILYGDTIAFVTLRLNEALPVLAFVEIPENQRSRLAILATQGMGGVSVLIYVNGLESFFDFRDGGRLKAPEGLAIIGEFFRGSIGPAELVGLAPLASHNQEL